MNKLINKFKALGDETRFKIFLLLSEKQICVKGLANALGISESAVSQHIKVLKNADLLKGKKVGYYIHYQVQKTVLIELQGIIGALAEDVTKLEETKIELNVMNFDCTKICNKNQKGCDHG